MNNFERHITDWMAKGETGISSRAIAFKILCQTFPETWDSHPRDPDDLRRCLILINQVVGIRERLGEMRAVINILRARQALRA